MNPPSDKVCLSDPLCRHRFIELVSLSFRAACVCVVCVCMRVRACVHLFIVEMRLKRVNLLTAVELSQQSER